MKNSIWHIAPLLALVLLCAMPGSIRAEPLPLPHPVPHCFSPEQQSTLNGWHARVERELKDFLRDARAFNAKEARLQSDEEYAALQQRRSQYLSDVKAFNDELDRHVETTGGTAPEIVVRYRKLAKTLGWGFEKQACLAVALNTLDLDPSHAFDQNRAAQAWRSMTARGEDPVLAAAARAAGGMKLTGAGTQTNYLDCALFSLANAVGLPYGIVAARATELIRDGEWRDPPSRADPQHAIENLGLTGGELVMLAEGFGQARVIAPEAFVSSIQSGEVLMVRLSPSASVADHGHEVVLATSFEHGGQTWFEVLDSNYGPLRRLFGTLEEVESMLLEKGVAFRAEPGSTPALLR